jgi:N6-adenosine-specific RNA methylase IME4
MLRKKYRCNLLDPPWKETGGGKIKRGADRHYKLLKPYQIIETVIRSPLWNPADDAHMWLCVTNNHFEDGLFVMKALGFRYVTKVTWAKMEEEIPGLWKLQRHGLGQYLFGLTEDILFGVRGRLPALKKGTTLLTASRTKKHSEKPTRLYELIERVSPGPRAEFFARARRKNWAAWGNEV